MSKYPRELRAAVCESYLQDLDYQRVFLEYGVSKNTISNWLREMGISTTLAAERRWAKGKQEAIELISSLKLPDETQAIPLTQGKYTLVDGDEYDWLMLRPWHYSHGYAKCPSGGGRGVSRPIPMHLMLLEHWYGPSNLVGDHKNGDTLDNRRDNLRWATQQQNAQNARRGKDKEYTSKYKGVYWKRRENAWAAAITVGGESQALGLYHKEEDAAFIYNQAAMKHQGDFAALNELPDWADGSSRVKRKNKSGTTGVCYDKNRDCWRAFINVDKKWIGLGRHKTFEEALKIRKQAEELYGVSGNLACDRIDQRLQQSLP